MSFIELLSMAFATLRIHKLRSVLTTLGVMIGVTTVIGMLALINGLNALVMDQLASIGTNTLYVQKQPWVLDREEQLKARKRPNLTIQDAEAIARQVEHVRRVAPLLTSPVGVRFQGNEMEAVVLIGTTPEYQYITDFQIASGRPLTEADIRGGRRVVVIGATLVEKLFPSRDPLGKTMLINGHHFEVVATLQEKGAAFGADQDNLAIIPVTAYIRMISGPITRGGDESVTIVVQPDSPERIDQVSVAISALLRRRRNVPPGEEDNFNINTADQLMQTYQTITSGIFGLMIGVTTLSLVVGGIGIMNIMLVSVSERIREIGIRKAVGARGKDIRAQFLTEAVTLSCVGGIIGMLLGFGLAAIVSRVINLPAAVTWWSIVLGFGFSVFVGVFFGWYPARRAASLSPIEALRHE
jgi:putative ABC transport system permease protein